MKEHKINCDKNEYIDIAINSLREKINCNKNKYMNIAMNSLREKIELLNDELSNLTTEFENLYNERNELLKAVETLESIIDNNDSDNFI